MIQDFKCHKIDICQYIFIKNLMKKVVRRVVEREATAQDQDGVDRQTNQTINLEVFKTENMKNLSQQLEGYQQRKTTERNINGKRSEILIPGNQVKNLTKDSILNQKNKNSDEVSVSPNSQLKVAEQAPKVQSSQASNSNKISGSKNGEDERKSRIEMLKQKYLKKGPEIKIQMNKTDVQKQNGQETPQTSQADTQSFFAEVKTESKIAPRQQEMAYLAVEQKPIKTEPHQPTVIKTPIIEQKTLVKPIQQSPPSSTIKNQVVKQKVPISQKVEEKKPFKVPPPPPPPGKHSNNRSKVPPPPVVKHTQNQQQQVQIPKEETAPKETTIQNVVQVQQYSPAKEPEVFQPSTVPSPPPLKGGKSFTKSPLVQQLLSKRSKKDEQNVKNEQQVVIQNTPNHHAEIQAQAKSPSTPEVKQYHKQEEKAKPFNLSQSINCWLNSPFRQLQKVLPNIHQILREENERHDHEFHFTSKNPNFNSSLAGFVSEFVLKNKNQLTEGQRKSLYAFSLEFFNNEQQKLSPQFLLILIKLGSTYLQMHKSSFCYHLEPYASIILINRTYFTQEELSAFINFTLNLKEITESQLILLLLIHINEKLVSYLINKSSTSIEFTLALLSCLHIRKKQFPILMTAYLKLINQLIENTPDDKSLIEMILKHVNELQNNQKSYQLHKQIKLKLISMLSNTQATQKPQTKVTSPEPPKESGGDGGFLGYWSKAVDKIKTATVQFADSKFEKAKPVQQEEEKEEEITYDPVLKRYLINGKVPEDDSSRPSDQAASKLPPPPPPPKNTNRPAPPPLPGKKGRPTTNRYA